MIKLQLTREEQRMLREIIEADLSDLRVEIVSTDRLDFKNALKRRKETLSSILEKLQEQEVEKIHQSLS
ncbi:MAG: hypothetical protein HZB19_08330 [Chloroflexi bacterium]|nr:hypothetical protein [Chloroflexota bacterium]